MFFFLHLQPLLGVDVTHSTTPHWMFWDLPFLSSLIFQVLSFSLSLLHMFHAVLAPVGDTQGWQGIFEFNQVQPSCFNDNISWFPCCCFMSSCDTWGTFKLKSFTQVYEWFCQVAAAIPWLSGSGVYGMPPSVEDYKGNIPILEQNLDHYGTGSWVLLEGKIVSYSLYSQVFCNSNM